MSESFHDNAVEEIKSRCNIVDVIGQVVSLKKMGNNFKGVCPFHNEKTPSFVVSEPKQIFTCFGCGATGDVFEFVKRYYNLDFPSAVERLAKEYQVDYSNHFHDDGKKELYYQINREAATFFYKAFTQTQNEGLSYMRNRGMEPETLKRFGIGYADEQWDSLYKHFMSKNVDVKILIELGLISESKGKYYDKFRNRVMFPIINTRGKVIGFGGRILGEGSPKYLNSQESAVFMKKNNLYGLNISRQEISKENYTILVEGYMDVISLYQSGIRNVAASLGTALTENQAKMLRRYSKNVVLSYDADNAGRAAALRGIEVLRKEGCKAKVLHISDGKDPDEFVRKKGKDAFKSLIQQSLGYVDYKIENLKNRYNLDSYEESIEFLKETAVVLRELGPVEADVYIKKLANEIKISENAIRLEINGNNTQVEPITTPPLSKYGESDRKAQQDFSMSISLIEKNLIKLMILDYKYYEIISNYERVFKTDYAKNIWKAITELYEENEVDEKEIDLKKLQDGLEIAEVSILTDIIDNVQLADKEEQVLMECINKFEWEELTEKENSLLTRLSMADEEENQETIKVLTEELMELQRKKLGGDK
ncbi:DNA primase [Clostridium aminobutyricum]|uniref:DNA primase n=1 Tax=Clostridium aminobutyricum TaxID=33953 RepID=A0A939IGS1_CLOAM|nr:DNA primase [Clostridium aminobutyricum]MBN7772407.1 DNA primase [Clostridium aminobutyricum]